MDPVTQGVLGAVFAQTRSSPSKLAKAAVIGAIAAMAPDLDVFIISSHDPLLTLQYHRQFTHSLLFIPIGGLLCALALYYLLRKRWDLSLQQTIIWSVLGFATHGLLDGCTSYGTQLLWPLSEYRYSWDIISIIDPLFTGPLLVLSYLAARLMQRKYMILAILWGAGYMSLGYIQHERAISMGNIIADSRGHRTQRIEVKPSFANLLVWKVIYETEDRLYVDAVKPGVFSSSVWEGDNIKKLDVARDFPQLDPDSQQALDIERFRKFSAGFLAVDPDDSNKIIDMRYSMLPHHIAPLWGIELFVNAPPNQHVKFYTQPVDGSSNLGQLLTMVFR